MNGIHQAVGRPCRDRTCDQRITNLSHPAATGEQAEESQRLSRQQGGSPSVTEPIPNPNSTEPLPGAPVLEPDQGAAESATELAPNPATRKANWESGDQRQERSPSDDHGSAMPEKLCTRRSQMRLTITLWSDQAPCCPCCEDVLPCSSSSSASLRLRLAVTCRRPTPAVPATMIRWLSAVRRPWALAPGLP